MLFDQKRRPTDHNLEKLDLVETKTFPKPRLGPKLSEHIIIICFVNCLSSLLFLFFFSNLVRLS